MTIMTQDKVNFSSLLLEIGTEDIPARFISPAIQQLKENTETVFKENHIRFSRIKTYGSPRRLALIAEGILPMQEDRSKEVFGPSKKIAFDESGRPTKAAIGFANSQGVSVESLVVKNKDKGEYVAAVIEEKGVHVREILPGILKKIVLSMHFPKSMRWGNHDIKFVRPIRWLLALFDREAVSFEIDGIKSGNATRGHRFLSPAAFQIKEIPSYARLLANNNVIVDPEERRKIISDKIEQLASSVGGMPVKGEKLFETVVHIVEYPVPVLGSFPAEYLKLPKELLITVMKEHQKYFAVEDREGKLINHFVVVSNTNEANAGAVRTGAERVIKARFEDARFYYEEDRKRHLQERVDDLKNVTFHEKLGSLYDKVLRVKSLASHLALIINPSLEQKAERAALLSKTDLITGVVREFPELQGIMGRYYAVIDSEDREVADALMEQYLPPYHGGRLPETDCGAILSIADKIDNISSFFSIGLIPTGSEDPFALRRQTMGIIAIMLDKGYAVPLNGMFAESFKTLKIKHADDLRKAIFQFFEQRLEPLFLSQDYELNVIQSVISFSAEIPLREMKDRLDSVREFKKHGGYDDFITAIKRVKNIIPSGRAAELKAELFSEEPEKRLHEKTDAVRTEIKGLLKEHKYLDALRTLSDMTGEINNFFDNVLVMDKRKEVKLNRLALLAKVWSTASALADFSRL